MILPKLPPIEKEIIREILQVKEHDKSIYELSSLSRFVCFNLVFVRKQEINARNLIRYFQHHRENMIIESRQQLDRALRAMKEASIEIIHNKK